MSDRLKLDDTIKMKIEELLEFDRATDLAEKLGVHVETISRWCNNPPKKFNRRTVIKINNLHRDIVHPSRMSIEKLVKQLNDQGFYVTLTQMQGDKNEAQPFGPIEPMSGADVPTRSG